MLLRLRHYTALLIEGMPLATSEPRLPLLLCPCTAANVDDGIACESWLSLSNILSLGLQFGNRYCQPCVL